MLNVLVQCSNLHLWALVTMASSSLSLLAGLLEVDVLQCVLCSEFLSCMRNVLRERSPIPDAGGNEYLQNSLFPK